MSDAERVDANAAVDGRETNRANARRLMEEARLMLTEAGAISAATYLEYAIASIDLVGAIGRDDDERPSTPSTPDPVVIRALGGTMAVIGTILARSNIVSLDEFGRLFALYATVSAQDDPQVGTIVAGWGGMILEAAHALEHGPST